MNQIESWKDRAIDWLDLSEAEQETIFEQLPEDGRLLIFNLPNENYHRAPGVSASALKRMNRSAHSYKYGGSDGETSAMAFGTLCHAALLEPDTLNDKLYVFLPQDDKGKNMVRNAAHQKYKDFLATVAERTIVTKGDWENAKELAVTVRKCPEISRYLNDSSSDKYVEVSIFWIDVTTSILCRCRPDLLIVPHDPKQFLTCFDLKTLKDSSMRAIQYEGERFRHHPLAASFYTFGLMTFFERKACWILIAAEKTDKPEILTYLYEHPYEVIPIAQHGRNQVYKNLQLVAECEDSGEWPREHDGVRKMEPSSYLLHQMNDEEEHYNAEPF